MSGARPILEDLAVIFCVASVATIVVQRLRQPVVLGYLVAGLIVGQQMPVPLLANLHYIEELSELGVILVIFSIGLEFRFARLRAVLPTSGLAAMVQVPAMMWVGYTLGRLLGWGGTESLFVGGMICISSTMLVVRVVGEDDGSGVADNVLGMLVSQDLAAILLIAVFTAIASGAELPAVGVLKLVGQLVLFLAISVVAGILLVPRLIREAYHLRSPEVLLIASIGVCFGLALIAEQLGFSVALGAFIAGSVIAESGRRRQVEHLVEPIRDLFAAVFFVSIGMLVDPAALLAHAGTIAAVSAVIVVGHTVFATLGSVVSGRSVGVAVRTGMTLAQIGEFAFIIVGLGVGSGAVGAELMAITVGAAVVTTFLTPVLVRVAPATAAAVERRLPRSLQTFVALYAAWLESLRARRPAASERSLVRSVTAVAAYLVAMVAIIVGLRVGRAPLLAELSRRFGLAHDVAAVALAGCGLVLALPFVLGFARRVRRIGTELAGRVLPTTSAGVDLADAPRRALVVGLELAASMLALVPLLAVTAPFLPLYAGGGVLAVVMLGLGNLFWRRARNLHGHARAGAELVLELLDRQRRQDDDEPARSALPQLLPGLGPLAPIDIAPDSEAAGKTLAELNLRVRTGATVLAVKRADGSGVGMPAGHDRVDVGDVLTVSGTTEAVELARRLLAPPSPRRRPPDDVA